MPPRPGNARLPAGSARRGKYEQDPVFNAAVTDPLVYGIGHRIVQVGVEQHLRRARFAGPQAELGGDSDQRWGLRNAGAGARAR